MARPHDVVLVGGGHAHVQVLRRWAMRPPPDARLTVVLDRPVAVYSGMVPGFAAGQYAAHELEIDVLPLARRARARVVLAPATRVDPEARRVELAGRPPLPYDTASFDVGSTVAGLELPGVAEHAFPTRPIVRFVRAVGDLVARARERARCRLAIVGGGAGGVELAFCLRERLLREGVREIAVALLEAGDRLLPGYADAVAHRVAKEAETRGIEIRTGTRVLGVEPGRVRLDGGEALDADAVVWVVGAASLPLFRDSGLPTDAAGFVRVTPALQVEGRPELFAVGDCAAFDPGLPKAGVYAVRAGPTLTHNLFARVRGRSLRRYRPQRDFLTLLNLGDGTAIGTKWGRAFGGRSAFALKDWIDRRFVRRFQVLAPDGARTRAFPEMPGMSAEEMPCGGCAAKVGATPLARALERLGVRPDPDVRLGLESADDAAAVELPGGELVVATIDAFRAFTDDPWLVGRAAAVNAASDLWAKGVAPRFALAHVTVPEDEDAEEVLYQVLAGARAALDPASVTLVGGHTTTGAELAAGFAVWAGAERDAALLVKGGLAVGDRLVLTKPLGTGVLLHADMRGLARGPWLLAAHASMLRPNAAASGVALEHGATACTDVSGFGLAGHLAELLRASKTGARIELGCLPLLPGARELLGRGLRSTFHPENARARRALRVAPGVAARPELEALFDPQTSGGLLLGVPEARAAAALRALHEAGDREAALIGRVEPLDEQGALFEVVGP